MSCLLRTGRRRELQDTHQRAQNGKGAIGPVPGEPKLVVVAGTGSAGRLLVSALVCVRVSPLSLDES